MLNYYHQVATTHGGTQIQEQNYPVASLSDLLASVVEQMYGIVNWTKLIPAFMGIEMDDRVSDLNTYSFINYYQCFFFLEIF